MPIYEYWCHDCRKRVSLLWQTVSAAASARPECPECDSSSLTKMASRVAFLRSEEARLDSLADPDGLAGLEDEDPRAMARWMRQMGEATGENLGDEFDEMVGRLEAGEDPESIEESIGDALGDDGDLDEPAL